MENNFNLQKATKTISSRIIDSKNMLEAIEEIIDLDKKSGTLISYIKNNLISAFNDIEQCRKIIAELD